jgi:hypothetical protein
MDAVNNTDPNRLQLLFDQNAGDGESVAPPQATMTDAAALQTAFSQFQTYRLASNQGMPGTSPDNAAAPQSSDFTSMILDWLRALLNRANGNDDDQPIPVGFETGPHVVTGWGTKEDANNVYYADSATAQRLADALGAKVVSDNPFGGAQAPDAATLEFPGGQKINAGVLANLLNRGYSRDYVESQLSQALKDNGVTDPSIDMSKLYSA